MARAKQTQQLSLGAGALLSALSAQSTLQAQSLPAVGWPGFVIFQAGVLVWQSLLQARGSPEISRESLSRGGI